MDPVDTASLDSWVHSSIQHVHLSRKRLLLLPHNGDVSKTTDLKKTYNRQCQKIIVTLELCYVCHYFNDMHPYLPPANGKTVLNGAKASETEFLPSL
jgi:hypothetical protein